MKLADKVIKELKRRIDVMSHRELAELCRFGEVGSPYFRTDLPLYEHWRARFLGMGGMTPEISKEIGWRDLGDPLGEWREKIDRGDFDNMEQPEQPRAEGEKKKKTQVQERKPESPLKGGSLSDMLIKKGEDG